MLKKFVLNKSHVGRVDFSIHSENVMIEFPLKSDEAGENWILRFIFYFKKSNRFQIIALKREKFKMALARMANEEQIRFVRLTQIEQERIKLTTAQGKRMVPIFLDLLNDVGDLEYVSSLFLLFLGFKFFHF